MITKNKLNFLRKISGLLLFFYILNMQAQKIERIEPPFWWADMHQTKLQILCYGNNMATYDVKVPNAKLINLRKTENPNYLFINIDTEGLAPGMIHLDFYRDGQKLESRNFELKTRKNDSRYRKGFDSSDVMYLLMPDRFANDNPKNDSQPDLVEKLNRDLQGGRHGGDIQGIINHVDYLKDLGVTAIWSTPLLENKEPIYSYHTYAQSDFYKIDPRFGSNQDYRDLADKLHQNDMKLVMDYVTNHWGSKHWMIKDLPSKDWIHYWESGEKGFQRSSYRMSTQFDLNASEIDTKACENGWFDTSMPDMNQSNPLLLQYLKQNAIWWIEYADLDGFRVDTYSYNDKWAIAEWTKAIMDEYPNFNIVGEVWMHQTAQNAFWQKDSPIGAIENFNSYLPTVMDFTLNDAIPSMFNDDEMHWNNGLFKAYMNFANDFLYADVNNLLVFMGNHDMTRINEHFKGNLKKYKLALSLILTIRGIPQLYYADEIGMRGDKANGDGDIRKDFPGGWKGDNHNAFTASGRNEQEAAYFDFTKKLLNWRKENPVIHTGKTLHFVPRDNVYVYFRYNDTESVMVILNNSLKPHKLDWNRYNEGIRNFTEGKEIITDKIITVGNELIIEPKTPKIIYLTK